MTNGSAPGPMTTAERTSAAGEGASDCQRTEVATAAAPSTPTRTTNRRAGVMWVRASTPAADRGAGGAASSTIGPGRSADGGRGDGGEPLAGHVLARRRVRSPEDRQSDV